MGRIGMRAADNTRIPEPRLTRGLSVVYRLGYVGALLLMLIGLLFPLIGWRTALTASTAGMIVLLSTPVVSTLWVGYRALRDRDLRLTAIVLGIILLLGLACLLSILQ